MTKAALIRNSKRQIFFLFAVALLVLGLPFASTQNIFCQDTGCKYFRNYSSREYKWAPQNWSVLQDKRGIIYVVNSLGVLEFDGVSWRHIDVTNDKARSMAIDDAGIIYVGGNNEIGFLAPDSNGTLQYVSLLEHLDDSERNFSTVYRTHATKEGIYFRTSKFLFRWDANRKQIKTWELERKHAFNASFTCEGKFFIHQIKVGLMHIVNNALQLIPGGEKFKGENIYIMAPHGTDQQILIGTRSKGFYIYDCIKAKAEPFPTEVDDYLKKNILHHGIGLSSSPGDIALVTRHGGLVVIDSQGKLKQIFDRTSGLLDDNVKYVFEDSQGNIWLALNEGISKIEYASPIWIYDDRANLRGNVLSVSRHNKGLYAGTSSGLYFLESPGKSKFNPVPGVSGNCFYILSMGDSILAATTYGVFQVENNFRRRVIENPSHVLHRSKMNPTRIWVGTRQGLVSLYSKNKTGQWEKEHTFEKISQEIRSIVEDKKGNLWLGTPTKGVFKADFPGNGTIKNPVVTPYHTSQGLPPGRVGVFMAAGHVMVATRKGIFRFDELKKVFAHDYTLGDDYAGGEQGRSVFRIVEDKNKNIWLHSFSKNRQAILQPDGTFVHNRKPFRRIHAAQVNTIYPDPDGYTTWFAGEDGLIGYDTRVKKNYDLDFPTLIRKVIVNGKLVFDGYKYRKDSDSKSLIPTIEYKERKNFHFEFAAPFFEAEFGTMYRSLLEGLDDHWSDWNLESNRDFTILDSGLYTFRVRAKNVYENISREAVFQFKILPPWYRTWWAYAVYVFAGFLVLFLVVKWRLGKLQREKKKLEQIVRERTKEIKEKNLQLEEQSKKLKEIDHVKSRFFANISHEFRTPLTLIMGPLEQVLSDYQGKDSQLEKKVKLMLRNSQRLFTLINRLLDLSKLDSGKMQLKAARQNIIPFLKGMVASFDLLANQYDLDLTFHPQEEDITLYFDLEKMEDVLCNLLINAVKFTPGGGKITVAAKRILTKEEPFPAGYLEISIGDTGPGIPREQLAHIFDRFYQSDSTYEHHQKGTGIGLALTRDLIHLHHGRIDVHSRERENSGTEFIIRLPLGKEHLDPHQMVTPDETPIERRKPFEIPAAYMVEKEQGVPTDVKESQTGNGQLEKDIILVVEDSADVREYIRGALEPLYAVKDAKNGKQGIRKAQEIIPDLIISDIMMPGVDGYELCETLKKDIKTSHIPIILLTAKASEENILRGLETGADDYITKPFSTKLLMARIKNLIDLRRHFQLTLYRQMTRPPVKMSLSQMDREFIKELQDMIEKNLSDPDFNVERLGKKLYMSRATLYRKIHALSGESPNEFLQSYRLKRGVELLENNFGSVLEVAFEVGFSSASYFSKCFKKKFNQLPSAFQPTES